MYTIDMSLGALLHIITEVLSPCLALVGHPVL